MRGGSLWLHYDIATPTWKKQTEEHVIEQAKKEDELGEEKSTSLEEEIKRWKELEFQERPLLLYKLYLLYS